MIYWVKYCGIPGKFKIGDFNVRDPYDLWMKYQICICYDHSPKQIPESDAVGKTDHSKSEVSQLHSHWWGSAGTWKPPYEAFDVLRVKIIKGSNWWASGERGCLLIIGQDKVPGRPNNWLKKKKTEIEICCKILCENVILKYGLKVH